MYGELACANGVVAFERGARAAAFGELAPQLLPASAELRQARREVLKLGPPLLERLLRTFLSRRFV
ncbi:MAG: hypothetical protein M1570_02150, partial [Chloroflexi bacterium]|nr:hypothetical protein [Chloroflexota bacterium]